MENGQTILGSQTASNSFKLFMIWNLVNPICSHTGRNSARSNNGIQGRGESKKRMSNYNDLNKGSKFALIQKDADLLYGVLLHEWRYDL